MKARFTEEQIIKLLKEPEAGEGCSRYLLALMENSKEKILTGSKDGFSTKIHLVDDALHFINILRGQTG